MNLQEKETQYDYVINKMLGKRIAHLRRQAGLTQEQLAEKEYYSVEFVSFVERGVYAPFVDGWQKLWASM